MQPGHGPNPQLAGALMLIAGVVIAVGLVTKQFVVVDDSTVRVDFAKTCTSG